MDEGKQIAQDFDEADPVDGQELPEAIIDDELVVRVRPQTQNEFTCGECFLVRHHSMLAGEEDGVLICRDCASD